MSPASASCLASLDRRSRERAASSPRCCLTLSRSTSAQRRRRVGRPQVVLELVEVAQAPGGVGPLPHPHGLVAAEAEALVPPGPGKGPLQVAGQPIHLPAQVEVLEQRLGQPLELRALLGGHRVPHGLGGGHPGGQLGQELVEIGRVAREQIPELLHEGLERRIDLLAGLPLLDHPVEGVEGLAHVGQLRGIGIGQRLRHLIEVGPGHLLAQPLDQFLEVLARLGGDELVVLQAAHHAGQIAREQVELHPPLGGHLVGDLPTALVPGLARIGLELFDADALLGQHLLQLLGDLAVGAAEVAAVELLLPLQAQLVQQVAQPLDLFPVRGPPPPVEHPLQRLVQVAVGQQVVGQLRQHGVGVVDQRVLGPVPAAVVEAPGHPRPRYVARDPAASLLSRLVRCSPSSRNSTALATTPGPRTRRSAPAPGPRAPASGPAWRRRRRPAGRPRHGPPFRW